MTKVITSTAALRLVEAGRLGPFDQSLEEWLPGLASRRVLSSSPTAEPDDTVPARRAITLRHLLTNASGHGMVIVDSPLQKAMADSGTEAGPEPLTLGAEVDHPADRAPLAFQPGEGWRYHHSFGLLGILIARLTGRTLGEHLAEDLFDPLGMTDTALWVPEEKMARLPAAYRFGNDGLVEMEPAGGGFYAGPPAFDVSHTRTRLDRA